MRDVKIETAGDSFFFYFKKGNEAEKVFPKFRLAILPLARKTLALDSTYAEAHFTAGMTYYKIGGYPRSIAELNRAADISGSRAVVLAMLGVVNQAAGNTEKARELLAEMQQPPLTNDKLYAIATIKSNLGETEEALDIFENCLTTITES